MTYAHLEALARANAIGAQAVLDHVGYLEALIAHGPAFAGVADEGVIAAMGMVEDQMYGGNWRCWAVTHPELAGRYFLAVCLSMRRFLREHRKRRIETVVQFGNSCGQRWVEALGFRNPQLMKNFNEHGSAWLYELTNG